jgi:hypothetical protein
MYDVRMYVYIYIYIYIYIHTHIHIYRLRTRFCMPFFDMWCDKPVVHAYIYIYICMYTYIYIWVCAHVHLCVYIHKLVSLQWYLCMCVGVLSSMHARVHTYRNWHWLRLYCLMCVVWDLHAYIRAYIHTHMCVIEIIHKACIHHTAYIHTHTYTHIWIHTSTLSDDRALL